MLESNTSRPLIHRPNFAMAKIVTGLAIAFLFLSMFINFLISYLSFAAIGVLNLISPLLLYVAYFYLSEYLKNFEGTNTLRYLLYTYLGLRLINILVYALVPDAWHSEFAGLRMVLQLFHILVAILLGLIAVKLIAFRGDFVGGLNTVGYLSLGVAFLTIASSFALLVLYTIMEQSGLTSHTPIFSLVSSVYMLSTLMTIGMLIYLIVIYINAEKYNEMINM